MPELPDVESFKRHLKNTSLNKKVINIDCQDKNLVKGISFSKFKKRLIGKSFKQVSRRGKFLIVDIEGAPQKLILHFGMTGGLFYARDKARPSEGERFSRLAFKFKNGDVLHWLNMRKFGKVYLVKDPSRIDLIKQMGPEPLELSKAEFLRLLEGHNKNIKAFLLDQRDIAGIGNIYSDEILFRAKINPRRKTANLTSGEKVRIYKAMIKVLKEATKIMSSSRDFSSSWLFSHRGEDMGCPKNKSHRLKREIIAGRAAIYCPACQKDGVKK